MGDETPKKSGSRSSLVPPSSLPKPTFLPEPKSFSTKKVSIHSEFLKGHLETNFTIFLQERGTPPLRPPPRPQAKTCPPISRVFKRRQELFAAQAVSFRDPCEDESLTASPFPTSKHYEPTNKASYFEQVKLLKSRQTDDFFNFFSSLFQAFTIEEKIGAGCFGTVYKVRSKEDGKLYAVKIATERYRGLSDRKEKLEEVRKHQFLLPHTNCVRFYQSWEDSGRLYQKFELCQKSLMDISEEKHDLPESQIWDYLIDLLLAVQHLHDHDLIHMDIKPENIFIGMDGICKLGDFGLVIDLAKMDSSKVVEGDPRYLASELLTERKFTKAADIFSLGVTILELATDLDLPKHGLLWHQLRQTGPDPQLTKHLSQDLRSVIQHMMLNDHERRPTVEQVLKIPAVKKHKTARMRKLAFHQFLQSLKSTFGAYLWPIVAFLFMLYQMVISGPIEALKCKIQRCYDDSKMHTPVLTSNQNGGFLAPYPPSGPNGSKSYGVSFSSEESDTNQTLATPLRINFSDEEDDESVVFSPSHPRRSKRNLKNQK